MKKFILLTVLIFSISVLSIPEVVFAEQTQHPEIPSHMNNTSEIGINLSLSEVVKPLPEEQYYGRQLLSENGKKAWDYVVELLLDYDNSDDSLQRDAYGNTIIDVNYQETIGVLPTESDAKQIQRYLVRNDARMFHLKDWGADYKKNGQGVISQKFYIGNGVQNSNDYHLKLLEIEHVVSQMLKQLKDDMTIYQQVRTLQSVFESSVSYGFGGAESDIRGAFLQKTAICGGYSKGFMYLMHRIGLNCIWVDGYTMPNGGGYHAWNYIEIYGKWYMVDTTWGGDNWFLQGQNYREDGFAMHDHNMTFDVMPTLAEERIPANYGKYPSVTMQTKESAFVVEGSEFDLNDLVVNYNSIYNEDLSNNIEFVTQLDTDKEGRYEVIVKIHDDHGNVVENKCIVSVVKGEKSKLYEEYNEEYTLLQNGQEVAYTQGYLFKEYSFPPRTLEVDPQAENIIFEARVGIIGSVRQNVNYGHYAGVKFTVEFLASDNTVLSTYETQRHGWKTESEFICLQAPENTNYIRISSVTFAGTGNNHSFWADVAVTAYDDIDDETLIPAKDQNSENGQESGNGQNSGNSHDDNNTSKTVAYTVIIISAVAVITVICSRIARKSKDKNKKDKK